MAGSWPIGLGRRALALFTLLAIGLLPTAAAPAGAVAPGEATVFVNEVHYDNDGIDVGEAIEVAGPAGTDLTGWRIVLYNGTGGAAYGTRALGGTIADQQAGFGTVSFTYPSNGIQNGSPDGIALVDPAGQVVQLLSYEGSFTAVGGPAGGLASTDIGVVEGSGTPLGRSLQLTGAGDAYGDFTWAVPAAASFGTVNVGQTFGEGAAASPDPSRVTCRSPPRSGCRGREAPPAGGSDGHGSGGRGRRLPGRRPAGRGVHPGC